MSSIIVAGFESVEAAESAMHALLAEGFRDDAVHVFNVDGDAKYLAGLRRAARAAVLHTAILAAAGAALAVAGLMYVDVPGAFGIVAAALGALAGAGAAALLSVLHRNWLGRPRRMALVAVLAEAGEEIQGAQLLSDAGGVRVPRRGGRWPGWSGTAAAMVHQEGGHGKNRDFRLVKAKGG
ncbi:hypothetical protein [Achromobacter aloeverae]|uniref:Uncharacterized protein n=1 Tax=Achromobacter aloeverae TaxID=1750518 RepID=A0A4Q1HKY1_9BURK|nr:hypothetical protein [Achromobacter aloeverae]RXN90978.1 hypothetical protein C7R54_07165 [Achromobacter aloeverae]